MPIEYTLDTLHRTIDSLIKERDALAAELDQFKDEALKKERDQLKHLLYQVIRRRGSWGQVAAFLRGQNPIGNSGEIHDK